MIILYAIGRKKGSINYLCHLSSSAYYSQHKVYQPPLGSTNVWNLFRV